jgi:hypothetical protein
VDKALPLLAGLLPALSVPALSSGIFPRHIGGRQEDAHEMLALLLDALDPPLPKVKSAGGAKKEVLPEPTELPSTPIQQILGGTLRNKGE